MLGAVDAWNSAGGMGRPKDGPGAGDSAAAVAAAASAASLLPGRGTDGVKMVEGRSVG